MTEVVSEPGDLYGLPLEEFTAQRNQLERRLRDEGKPEVADEVAALRKPTTDAWALNQVVRRSPDKVGMLARVNRKLRQAEEVDVLLEAGEERRRVVDEIVDSAASILADAGHSSGGSVRDRIIFTLLATGADPEAERALVEGHLTRPIEISEEWPVSAMRPTAVSESDSGRRRQIDRLDEKAEQLAARAERLKQEAEKAREALADAKRRARDAEKTAERAYEEALAAREHAEKALRGE